MDPILSVIRFSIIIVTVILSLIAAALYAIATSRVDTEEWERSGL